MKSAFSSRLPLREEEEGVPSKPSVLEAGHVVGSVFYSFAAVERHSRGLSVTSPPVGVGQGQSAQVGGRLQLFIDKWESLILDPWVVQTVVSGYKIEFTASPPLRFLRETKLTHKGPEREAHLKEVRSYQTS